MSAPGALETELLRRFRTTETAVQVRRHAVSILHPANSDDLITEEDYVRDERLPYWADLWPSSHVLADRVVEMRGAGQRLLELGCGSGLVSVAAALAGYAVTATDYYDDALLFTKANVRRNAGMQAPVTARHVDWRDFPDDLGTFDVVVASDVLYEHTYGPLVAAAFRATLGKRSLGLLADPGRIAADAFVDECRARGLLVAKTGPYPFERGEIKQQVHIYEITARGT